MEALLLVADHDGPTMFARIGIMRALHTSQPRRSRRAASARRHTASSEERAGVPLSDWLCSLAEVAMLTNLMWRNVAVLVLAIASGCIGWGIIIATDRPVSRKAAVTQKVL